jgi:hypothetical protein
MLSRFREDSFLDRRGRTDTLARAKTYRKRTAGQAQSAPWSWLGSDFGVSGSHGYGVTSIPGFLLSGDPVHCSD